MITSPHNEKLKLVRKLRERKHREREGLFATEGEDLLAAGLAAGARAGRCCSTAAGAGLGGEEVEPELLDAVSTLGSGTRAIAVWPQRWTPSRRARPCVYLHGVGDPGNVGTIVRTADGAARRHASSSGPAAPTPTRRRRCGRAWARSSRQPPARAGVGGDAGAAGRRWSPTAARGLERARRGAATLCLGAEREGLPAEVLAAVRRDGDDPAARGGAESLNVAAAAAIALQRISSLAMAGGRRLMLERIEEIQERGRGRDRGRAGDAPSSRSCGSATSAARPS